jgi:putative PIN family toxin of toxin-antitoxin system
VVSERLLVELEAVFAYPKLRRRVDRDDAAAVVAALRAGATVVADQETAPRRAADPADDYLLALAESQRAVVVSGDRHLLDLAGRFPVLSPREFVDLLG